MAGLTRRTTLTAALPEGAPTALETGRARNMRDWCSVTGTDVVSGDVWNSEQTREHDVAASRKKSEFAYLTHNLRYGNPPCRAYSRLFLDQSLA